MLVANNGFRVLFNRYEGGYEIEATYKDTSDPLKDVWKTSGKMQVDNADYDKLVKLLCELV